MLVTGALLYSRIQAASMVHSFHVYQMSKWQVLMKSAIVKIHPAVCDGKTIGHPCCAVHDCKEPLINNRHRFCATHNIHNLKCAVTACNSQHEASHRTCSDPDHRALENAYFKHGKGIYKLRERLKAAGGGSALASSESSSIPEDHEEDDKEVLVQASQSGAEGALDVTIHNIPEATVECGGKAETGNRRLQAFFGRRRTHNEQVMMRSCGIIISRATFFGSEAISAVKVCVLFQL